MAINIERSAKGALKKETHLAFAKRQEDMKAAAGKLFERLVRAKPEDRAALSQGERKRMRKQYAFGFGPIEDFLISLAQQRFPMSVGSARKIAVITGITIAGVNRNLVLARRRKEANSSIIRGTFNGLMKAKEGGIVEKSRRIRVELARTYGLTLEQVNAIILQPPLRTRMTIRKISMETGINSHTVSQHEAKLAGAQGLKTRHATREERFEESRKSVEAAKKLFDANRKATIAEAVSTLKKSGVKSNTNQVKVARKNLADKGKVFPKTPTPREVYEYAKQHTDASPARILEEFSHYDWMTYDRAAQVRRSLIKAGEVPSMRPAVSQEARARRKQRL